MRKDAIRSLHSRSRQRGVAAMEFAFVFPVIFMLLYGTLHFGMVFTARLSLQHAAEEGAREALRFQQAEAGGIQVGCPGSDLVTEAEDQLQQRMARARQASCAQLDWLTAWGSPQIDTALCPTGVDCTTGGGALPDCGDTVDSSCQLIVTVTYPYAQQPIIPALPGFGIVSPTSLQGQARVRIDGRVL